MSRNSTVACFLRVRASALSVWDACARSSAFLRAYCERPELFAGHHVLLNPIIGSSAVPAASWPALKQLVAEDRSAQVQLW